MEYMTTGDQARVKKVTTSGIATEENAFDTEGRISQYKLTMTSRSSYPFTTDYTYDTANRLTQVTYPAQYGMTGSPRNAIVPTYDIASRLTQMTVDSGTQLSNVLYNEASQVTSLRTGAFTSTGNTEDYTYDAPTGLLTRQIVKKTSNSTKRLDLSYSYARGGSAGSNTGSEKTGQLTGIVDNLDRNRDRKYEFDALGRLATAKGGLAAGATGVTANWTQSYSYDRYGNKTGVTASGVDQNSSSIPADGLTSLSMSTSTNRVTTSGWEYDLAGNLIRGQNASGVWQRFEYDAAGRLVKIKDDSNNVIETYTYGASRERLMTETASGRTYYTWGGSNVTCEYTEATASSVPVFLKSYQYAGSRLLSVSTFNGTSETTQYHHPDRLGTRVITNSSNGSIVTRQSTLPFGTELPAEETGTPGSRLFTSYDRSASTGLDYAVNRTYSPGQSRFTQVDPIGMSAASVGNPQSNNLYAYVQNMPTDFTDPSGLNADSGRNCIQIVSSGHWSNDPSSSVVSTTIICFGGGFSGATVSSGVGAVVGQIGDSNGSDDCIPGIPCMKNIRAEAEKKRKCVAEARKEYRAEVSPREYLPLDREAIGVIVTGGASGGAVGAAKSPPAGGGRGKGSWQGAVATALTSYLGHVYRKTVAPNAQSYHDFVEKITKRCGMNSVLANRTNP